MIFPKEVYLQCTVLFSSARKSNFYYYSSSDFRAPAEKKGNAHEPIMISFNVPIYNKLYYLNRSLFKISSNYKNNDIEIVCIDANSIDGSDDFVRDLAKKDNRFSLMKRSEFTGTHIARSLAVSVSKGLYIWSIDPDDEVEIPMISKLIREYIKKGSDEDIIEFGECTVFLSDTEKDQKTVCETFSEDQSIREKRRVVETFTRRYNRWELWRRIVKRDVYLKAIELIKNEVPNNEDIVYASDLLHYAAIVFFAESYKRITDVGYVYYSGNPSSAAKNGYCKGYPRNVSKMLILNFLQKFFVEKGYRLGIAFSRIKGR